MAGTRTSRSDAGIMSLARSVLTDVLGLSNEAATRVIKIIRSQGELQDMKQSVRQMNAVAHRRLNHVIDMVGDSKNRGQASRDKTDPEDMTNESFIAFMLTELQVSDEDLRDPEKKQDIMRMMRANPQQAATMADRAERERKQDQRKEMQAETDPQKVTLMRRKQSLLKQIEQIDAQLAQTEQGTQ